jgi:hypothetical protein
VKLGIWRALTLVTAVYQLCSALLTTKARATDSRPSVFHSGASMTVLSPYTKSVSARHSTFVDGTLVFPFHQLSNNERTSLSHCGVEMDYYEPFGLLTRPQQTPTVPGRCTHAGWKHSSD